MIPCDTEETRLISNPIHALRQGSLFERRLALAGVLGLRFPHALQRAVAARDFRSEWRRHETFIRDLRRQGFVLIPRNALPVENLLTECAAALRGKTPESFSWSKDYLVPLLSDEELAWMPELAGFIMSRDIVAITSAYLRSLPFLTYLNVIYSPNDASSRPAGSQLWHLDHESYRQLKIFIYLNDVDVHSGATRIFDRAYTARKQKELGYRLDGDRKHFSEGLDDANAITLAGRRGDIVLLDPSSCFHRGGDGDGESRYMVMAQYLPSYAFNRDKFSAFRFLPGASGKTYRRGLLGAGAQSAKAGA